MEEKIQNAATMSPIRLLAGFLKGKIVFWIAMAVVIHIVLIGALSLGYIRDRWIDPDGAADRKAAALAVQEAEKQEALKKERAGKVVKPSATSTSAVAGVQAGAATSGVAKVSGTSTGATDQIPDDRKNSPVVKRITDKAAPGEIPTQPNDLGISINDTTIH